MNTQAGKCQSSVMFSYIFVSLLRRQLWLYIAQVQTIIVCSKQSQKVSYSAIWDLEDLFENRRQTFKVHSCNLNIAGLFHFTIKGGPGEGKLLGVYF